jgi:hypothetical protein
MLSSFSQLRQAESRANIIESEIESEFGHIVVSRPAVFAVPAVHRHSVRAQQANMSGEFRIRGRNHAAFSGRDVLVSEKAEAARVTPASAWLSVVSGARCMCGVFDDLQSWTFASVSSARMFAGMPAW